MARSAPRKPARKAAGSAARKPAASRAAGRKRHPHIVRIADVPWEREKRGNFDHERRRLGRVAGGVQLGASLLRLAPGKAAFPAHLHHANEEAILVLQGSGTLRLGKVRYPVSAGDYIALPVGTGEAHQIRNTSRAPLEYLVISTMLEPDVAEYPDSGKLGIFTGVAPGGEVAARKLYGFYMASAKVDYYKNEK